MDVGRLKISKDFGQLSKNDIKIVNVVATASYAQRIDLDVIKRLFGDDVQWNPEVFPGLVFRIEKPRTATLIFASGKMVCTGATSERGARKAVEKVVHRLKGKGFIILGKPRFEIQNIVASADLKGRIDLERAAFELEHVVYEPDQFPGLIYSMEEPNVVILIFTAGKLVITGARCEEMVYEGVSKLQRRLEESDLINCE